MNSQFPSEKSNFEITNRNHRIDKAKEFIGMIPSEMISKVFDVFRDIVRANKLMEIKDQEFHIQLQMIQSTNIDRKERIRMLMDFISNPKIPENCINQIVTSICNIAEGKNE